MSTHDPVADRAQELLDDHIRASKALRALVIAGLATRQALVHWASSTEDVVAIMLQVTAAPCEDDPVQQVVSEETARGDR
ncbi:hypothetical protein [Actinokineospora sp. UTMC 2448]|uniref:hypothetical protein n=1 Tax=Actinokineospora sp. UTMC 2448 TaxID=2268449 RepID=UPI00216445BA|nr:hypothetical protein [Actinokineospora sp. UTMC 2448]UVS81861.1 hypothetical protein Actkin_05625 [Actinokineospora sp. UTMC 2448]